MSKTEFSFFHFKTCSFSYNESGKHFYGTFYVPGMILSTLCLFTHLTLTTILKGNYYYYHSHFRWRKLGTERLGHLLKITEQWQSWDLNSGHAFNHYASLSHINYPATVVHTGTSFITFSLLPLHLNYLIFLKPTPSSQIQYYISVHLLRIFQ